MNILITNDDSIHAEGLKILIEALKDFGNLYLVAPEYPQSGMSVALSVRKALTYKPYKIEHVKKAYSIDGSPADCVRSAFSLFDVTFDLLVSGINQGANISSDVYHSGTLGAVFEGLILGIKGIALSGNYYDFSIPKRYAKAVIKTIIDYDLASLDYAINVNFPETMTTPKLMITHQGRAKERALYKHEEGKLSPLFYRGMDESNMSDLFAYYHEAISITPIKYDKTDYDTYDKMNKKLSKIEDTFYKHIL